jgi:hypothetical protein
MRPAKASDGYQPRETGSVRAKNEEVEGLEEMSDDERRKELDRFGKKAAQTHGYDHPSDTSKASSSAVKSELKAARKLVAGTAKPYRSPTSPANEEVEVDEAVRIRDRAYSSIERGHGDDKTTFQGQMDRAHIAAGAKARRQRTGPGVKGFNSAMRPAKASDGYQPRETGSVRAKNEEVEVDEAINVYMRDPAGPNEHGGTTIRYPKGQSAHGDQHRTMAAKAAKAARQTGELRGNDNRHTGWKKNRAATQMATGGVFAGRRTVGEDVEQIDEVDHPKNQADMLARLMHSIEVKGHPVAKENQFKATHGKDKTKKASLEPGQDMLQYAIAQGGNVKP